MERKIIKKELVIKEANRIDINNNCIRIHPNLINEFKLHFGKWVKVVSIKNPSKFIYQKIMAFLPAFRFKDESIVTIDNQGLYNLQLGLDDKILIEIINQPLECKEFCVDIIDATENIPENFLVLDHFAGKIFREGQTVTFDFPGLKIKSFIKKVEPKESIITPKTHITIDMSRVKIGDQALSFDDIGGVGDIIVEIREIIELPILKPDLFVQLGISPPKGILLSGPPGTGKTLLARIIASEIKAKFFHINGPELVSKFQGESESNIRDVFQKAKENAPSIIFIDELDSIAPSREKNNNASQTDYRIVAELLGRMDGLENRGNVFVLAATNLPNNIDPALRRPGRFDKELEINPPDVKGRLEILQIHTRGMPLGENVSLEDIANKSVGYVGADLLYLCKEAAMNCLRSRIALNQDLNKFNLSELILNQKDFLQALEKTTPSAMRDVLITIPDTHFDEIGGLDEVIEDIQRTVARPMQNPELCKKFKYKPHKGILLYGPPGTGKTMLGKAIANEMGVNFISIKGPELFSMWLGESERGIREIFRKARKLKPCVLFFDEIDALCPARKKNAPNSEHIDRVVSQFLTEIDGVEMLEGVLIIATSNRIDLIDNALLRSGRIDRHFYIGRPNQKDIQKLIRLKFQTLPLAADVDLIELTELISNKIPQITGATIEQIAQIAKQIAIDRFDEEKDQINTYLIKRRDIFFAIDNTLTIQNQSLTEDFDEEE